MSNHPAKPGYKDYEIVEIAHGPTAVTQNRTIDRIRGSYVIMKVKIKDVPGVHKIKLRTWYDKQEDCTRQEWSIPQEGTDIVVDDLFDAVLRHRQEYLSSISSESIIT